MNVLNQLPVHPLLNGLRVRPARINPPPVPPTEEDDRIKLMPFLDMIRRKTRIATLRLKVIEEMEHCHRQEYRWKVKPFIMLREVKDKLARRDWDRLFPESVAKKASIAVSIANNAALCRPKNYARLPLDTSTLYILSKLPSARVQMGIDSGEITPDTDYHQAVAFVGKNSRTA